MDTREAVSTTAVIAAMTRGGREAPAERKEPNRLVIRTLLNECDLNDFYYLGVGDR
jgi:hypothetical protein